MSILTQHITSEPRPPEETAMEEGKPPLIPGLADVILRAMHKEPDARYQTMDELVLALIPLYRLVAGSGMSTYMEAHRPPRSATIASSTPPPPASRLGLQAEAAPRGPSPMERSGPALLGSQTQGRSAPFTRDPLDPGYSDSLLVPKKSRVGVVLLVLLLIGGLGAAAAFVFTSAGAGDGSEKLVLAADAAVPVAIVPADAAIAAVAKEPPERPTPAVVPRSPGDAAAREPADAAAEPPPKREPKPAPAPADAGILEPPIVEKVQVLLASRPGGAEVYVDGVKQTERTPTLIEVPKGDEVEVVLKLRRFEDLRLTLDGSDTRLSPRLSRVRRAPRPEPGPSDDPFPEPGDDPDPEPPVDPCTENPSLPECMLE